MVGQAGVEPAIAFRRPDLQSGGFADSLLTHIKLWEIGDLSEIRTHDY